MPAHLLPRLHARVQIHWVAALLASGGRHAEYAALARTYNSMRFAGGRDILSEDADSKAHLCACRYCACLWIRIRNAHTQKGLYAPVRLRASRACGPPLPLECINSFARRQVGIASQSPDYRATRTSELCGMRATKGAPRLQLQTQNAHTQRWSNPSTRSQLHKR